MNGHTLFTSFRPCIALSTRPFRNTGFLFSLPKERGSATLLIPGHSGTLDFYVPGHSGTLDFYFLSRRKEAPHCFEYQAIPEHWIFKCQAIPEHWTFIFFPKGKRLRVALFMDGFVSPFRQKGSGAIFK